MSLVYIKVRLPRIVYVMLFSIMFLEAVCAKGHTTVTLEQLKNLDYRGLSKHPVRLIYGVYKGKPFVEDGASRASAGLVDEPYLIADLDGDGVDEAVVLISENSGGSGVYTYLAVVAWYKNDLKNVATLRLGDRIQIRSLEFDGTYLTTLALVAGEGEPLCCPTEKVRSLYSFQGGELTQVTSEKNGKVSIADLEGTTWRLTHFSREETVPASIDITLAVGEGQVSGKSGCNRYFGGVTGKAPREINFSQMGATAMACELSIMEAEQKYLRALGKVKRFGFQNSKLALSYEQDGTWETLLFTPSD